MRYPRVALTSAPESDAVVRCDLNEHTTWPEHDAFTLGAPPLKGEPGGVGADYDYRNLQFNLAIETGERQALAKQSELSRELVVRDENWLLFQLSANTSPVWFRCVRSSPGEMSLADVYKDRETNTWRVGVSLTAHPFAVGERIEIPISLSNDPSTGGVAVELPEIVGDAPAPLVIDGIDQGSGGFLYRPMVAVTPMSSWAGIQTWKNFTGDPGAFITADTQATDGWASEIDLASDTDHSLNGSVTTAQAGTYRLFVRLRGTTPFTKLTFGGTAAKKTTKRTVLPSSSSGGYFWVDMGLYVFPKGNQPLEPGYTLASAGDWTTPEVQITGRTTFGTASLMVDRVVAVPCKLFESTAPSRMLIIRNTGILGQRVDSEKFPPRIGRLPGEPVTVGTQARFAGGFPKVVPGAKNVLHLLTKVQSDDAPMSNLSEPLGATATLLASYRPQLLNLASG